MIRAVVFDYYSVFRPDSYETFIEKAKELSAQERQLIQDEINNYYLGVSDIFKLIDAIQIIFKTRSIPVTQLMIDHLSIPESFVKLTKELHEHFYKVSIAGNIGSQEVEYLNRFNNQTKQFDIIAGPLNYGQPLLTEGFFESFLNELGEPPQNCLVISGHENYIDFCNKIGIRTYSYKNFDQLSSDVFQILGIN